MRNDIVENILFGFVQLDDEHWILNLICLETKIYIYKSKQKKVNVYFLQFLPTLKSNLLIEKKLQKLESNRMELVNKVLEILGV